MTTPKIDGGCGETGLYIQCWWEFKTVFSHWEMVFQVLIKLNMQLPHVPEILLLDIYPRDMKTSVYIKFLLEYLYQLYL